MVKLNSTNNRNNVCLGRRYFSNPTIGNKHKNKLKEFKFLSFVFAVFFVVFFPIHAKADVRIVYEYEDISKCYIKDQTDAISRTRKSGVSDDKYYCLPSLGSKGVDVDRLEKENACSVGYELYSIKEVGETDANGVERYVYGYGCRKKVSQITNNLYCMYYYSQGVVMIADEGGKIKVKTHDHGIGDDLPSYNDSYWYNVREDVEILGTDIIKGGTCPNYVVEKFVTVDHTNSVVGFKFFNTMPSKEDADSFFGEYENYEYDLADKKLVTYTEKFNDSGELEENPDASGNEYYTEFYGDEVNNIISNNQWTNKCAYMNGEYELYFNDTKFVMRNVCYTEEVDIVANFTLTELLNKNNKECPATLHYAADGTFIRFWLEDLDNGLNYRDDTTLYEGKADCLDEPDPSPDLGDQVYGCDVIPDEIRNWIKSTLNLVKYVALALVIVLGILDFIKAAASGEADQMKKSGSSFLKRIIAVVILFLLPVIVELVLNLI